MKDLILAIRFSLTLTRFEYFPNINKLSKRYKRLRGEVYKKVIQWRKENPFVPIDDSEAREIYERRSFIKLELGRVYEVQESEMVFKNKNVCEVFPIHYQLGTMFKYLGDDEYGDHIFQGYQDEDYELPPIDVQILGIPSSVRLKDFKLRMEELQGLRDRKKEIMEEYSRLRKQEQDVIKG